MGICSSKKELDKIEVPSKSFFDFEINDIDGNLVQMSKFQGKKAYICVNVACSCRLTTQNYVELVEIYKQYKDKGLEILGFPCNQFRNQESKPEPEIKNYVTQKYGAHFPLFQKIEVNGIGAHDIYKYLRYNSELRINNKNEVKYVHWNFAKFLLDGNGNVINYYCPDVSPNDMIKDIEKLLKN
ncbi:unnamed protein product [Paramecium octaurelia]|uniref:Glutathione peroxidase n=1 Tax=Paramecium octaurelia TaxID=43137 RepID=A0A8S1SNF5_PAROT|nr:unnamed protein product [Paramecium octaurelia]